MKEIKEFSLNKNGEDFLTQNFKIKEFACKDNTDKIIIDIELVKKLQKIRDFIAQPIIIVSGYRTEDYNVKCGGATKSKHLTGEAIDFTCKYIKQYVDATYELAEILEKKFEIKGIGIYIKRQPYNYIHIDNRDNATFWMNDRLTQNYYNSFFKTNEPIKRIDIYE